MNSVYFDTITRRCYVESESGEECKRKFRLRGYDDGSYIRAQVKEKSLSAVFKRSVPIDPVTCAPRTWPSLSTDSPMYSEIRGVASEYGPMRPAVRIRYFRRRYRIFDYRITLDERISAEVCRPHIEAVRSFVQFPMNVLEVKMRSGRPYLPGLGRLNLGLTSFSKFLLGLTLLEGKPEVLNKYR